MLMWIQMYDVRAPGSIVFIIPPVQRATKLSSEKTNEFICTVVAGAMDKDFYR